MGVNYRNGTSTTLTKEMTIARENADNHARALVRSGKMTLDEYLLSVRGYRPEHLDFVRLSFQKSIFTELAVAEPASSPS